MQKLESKKILILYTAHTVGHQRIAENIAGWLKESGAVVVLKEVLKSNPSPLVQRFLKLHIWINVHAPWFWKFMYLWGFWLTMPLRLPMAWLQRAEIEHIIASEQPDMVITTQTSPSAVVSMLKRKGLFTGPWGIAFSDYHFHRYWMYPRADFYLVNLVEQVAELSVRGVSKDVIFRIGFALPPQEPINAESVKQKLGIPVSAKVILVGSGSLGVRLPKGLLQVLGTTVDLLAKRNIDCRVVVACGNNREQYQTLQQGTTDMKWLIPLPYYTPMSELYAVANIFITKPGGLTVAEAAQFGLSIYITHVLPGQEDLNLKYLEAHGYLTPLMHVPHSQWAALFARELEQVNSVKQKNGEFLSVVMPSELAELPAFLAGKFHEI